MAITVRSEKKLTARLGSVFLPKVYNSLQKLCDGKKKVGKKKRGGEGGRERQREREKGPISITLLLQSVQ
jgi:hypothetical protein